MKKGDVGAILFLVAFACAVVFFPWTVSLTGKVQLGNLAEGFDNFGKFTARFPYLMGFFKVGLLATFGEMLKVRVKTGSWKVPALFARFIVWGIVGLLFTFVFAMFGQGVGALTAPHLPNKGSLWFIVNGNDFGSKLLLAFSISFWQNVIFAFPMMLGHEWCNEVINQKRFVGGAEFLEKLNKPVWGSFIPKTIVFFWIPAHTVTFLLPPDYRVLMSAVLSLVLGAILTFRSSK